MDPRARFTATVADYVRYRPDYPEAFFDAWCARTGVTIGASVLERDGLSGRVWSSSYVRHSVKEPAAFDAALEALFEQHQSGGEVRFVYRTWGVLFA